MEIRVQLYNSASSFLAVRRRFELPEELLTVAEVAPLLRVCKATVYRMVKDGALPALRVLNGVRCRKSALAEFAMHAHESSTQSHK